MRWTARTLAGLAEPEASTTSAVTLLALWVTLKLRSPPMSGVVIVPNSPHRLSNVRTSNRCPALGVKLSVVTSSSVPASSALPSKSGRPESSEPASVIAIVPPPTPVAVPGEARDRGVPGADRVDQLAGGQFVGAER